MSETFNISLQADIKQLRDALASLPDIGGKEAGKMVKAIEKQYKAAERAAKQAGQNSEKEWAKSLDNIKGLGEKTAGLLGGAFGDIGDVVFDMGSKLGAIGGPAGIAVAGVAALALGAAGAATAIDNFIESADQGIKRLQDIAGSEPLPADSIQALDAYRQSSLGAEEAVTTLKVQVAALGAAAFEPAAAYAAGLANALVDMLPSVNSVKDGIADVAHISRVAVGVMSLGGSEAVRYALGVDTLTESAREGASSLRDLAREQEALNAHMSAAERMTQIQSDAILAATGASDAQQRLARDTDAVDEAVGKYIKTLDMETEAGKALADAAFQSAEVRKGQIVQAYESSEAEKALAKAKAAGAEAERKAAENAKSVNDGLREQRTAREALAAVIADSNSDQLTEEDKINAAYEVRIEKIRQAAAATLDYGAASAAEAEAEERRQRDLSVLRIEMEKTVADAKQAFDEADAKRKDDIAAKQMETLRHVADGFGFVEDGLSSAADVAQTMADTMVEGAQDGTEAEKKRALAAFRTAKALALAAAAIEAIRAGISLIPSYAYLGPFAPAAAAATAGAAFVVAAAKIASTKPPSFQRGGMVLGGPSGATPDHVQGDVQPGEFIATKQDVARNGGPRGVEQALRGGRQQPVHVHLSLNGRQIAEALWDPLGSLTGGAPLGRRPAMG